MKTIMRQLTAGTFIALILMVGNVKAEGTEIKRSSRECIEKTLQLENWMTDETIWDNNSFSNFEFIQEMESSLVLEDWMINEKDWNLSINFVEETEAGMELESWMINEETWILNIIGEESAFTIEPWMTDNNIWE